jgi:beta-lactamase class D
MRFLPKILLLSALSVPALAQHIVEKNYAAYFRAQRVSGSFLLYDLARDQYTVYDLRRSRQGVLPASTFKIPNTLLALETGVVRDTSHLFRWDGTRREVEAWNRDLTLAQALRVSCVPCYQEIARQIGAERYRRYLSALNFGRMDVRPDNVDQFWLRGTSRVTPFEQIDFLKRLYLNQLNIAERNMELTKALLLVAEGPGWVLRGKTGWGTPDVRPDGSWPPGARDIGWFVGWLEQNGNAYFFATTLEALRPVPDTWIGARRGITEQLLRQEFGLMRP